MNWFWPGCAAVVTLALLAALTPLPTDWVAFLLIASGAMIAEQFAVQLDSENRYSPAQAIYLGGSLLPEVGAGLVSLLLLVEAVARGKGNCLVSLGTRAPLVAALVAVAACRAAQPGVWWLPYLVGPSLLVAGQLLQARLAGRELKGKERLEWLRVRLKLRPLQAITASSALLVAAVMSRSDWLLLLLLPLLASTRYAAETIVLQAKDASTSAVLSALRTARGESRRARRDLARALTDNQIMERFTAHLAKSPDLQQTCHHLIATLEQLVEVDDVVVFLTPKPGSDAPVEPFLHRAQPAHQARLQGVALTRLQEPVVEQCWLTGKPREQRSAGSPAERIFTENTAAVAVPLGEFGVLYAGRAGEGGFSGPEKERIGWLSDKARLAFDAAFRAHNLKQEQALQRERVRSLERRVTLLGSLTDLAEAMASTLQLEELAERLGGVLGRCLPCDHRLVYFSWDEQTVVKRAWGFEGPPASLRILDGVRESGLPLAVNSFAGSELERPAPDVESVICAPLSAHEKICGAVLLGSRREGAFSKEALEQLRLMAYQAGMAFSNARLYHQVVVARKQLEESQQSLIQQSKLSAIGKLAAGVAHELNTPLGVITLSLEEARDHLDEMPELAAKMIDRALKAVHRSRLITDRMLAHSRAPSGEVGEVRLDQSIEETLSFLSFEIKNAEVKVRTELEPVSVVAQAQEFHQVMVNLVMNALGAMETVPEPERVLLVRLKQEGERVLVEVEDRGIGMLPEQRERAFEPFYTTKPVGKGTGLGLWVSLQFVEALGGGMEIESARNKGTRVTITLPASR